MGKTVNQTELAEILGVTDVTVWEWQKQEPPLPILERGERGKANQYDLKAVVDWYISREIAKNSRETQKDRLVRLQADMMEIELAREKGALVPVSEIEPLWQTRVLAAAAFLSGQPSRLAGILEATPGVEAKREILKREFALFLNRLGGDGDRMHAELEELLEKVSMTEAATFLQRISHGVQPDAGGPA